ncbi:sodium:proton antiporter [Curtobacterium sp. ISL-83]|uniref:sodium:proton antiporter n=1 Tax=Curtobacterium sp. ISL-83 TaxID=2819145 RepID=UPI001BE7BF8A|nr:sodium:proton antiporter [Curtobacterium sp. ISL-83]
MAIGVLLVLALLGGALALAVWRIVRGPTILDRMIGSDMVLTTVLVVIAAAMVIRRDLTALPVLVVIAATSVFATVAVARAVTPSSDPSDDGLGAAKVGTDVDARTDAAADADATVDEGGTP